METTHEPADETRTRINQQKCILVAEDSGDDLLLLHLAFERAGLSHKLVHAWNGEVAWDYLAGKPPFSDRDQSPFPDLLLLDLKMPCLDGLGLLRLLQTHRELSALPVVVLSSSALESDMQQANSLGAREFLTKPTGINEYRDMVLGLHQRWLGHAIPSVPKAIKLIRVLLRNFQTEVFFKSQNDWTNDPMDALNFEDSAEATSVAHKFCLQHVQICMCSNEGQLVFGSQLMIDP